MMADVPEVLANSPLSPAAFSTLQMFVPSGIYLNGRMFPVFKVAFFPA
eukprot:CAMPEP_0205810376 /NCGR_PEP_ID=MMETSP0205-20121125/14559_1 /ASSEMBLY_ACC=CAM_ASM_000278 /TAXON_ID=36767 /ORGANISM="Euplotes focardii, Strain TN1" /LENGTH=47 /DNA_ID= /DNA_START= /DNA_END= /DNA_ORIENTATION=